MASAPELPPETAEPPYYAVIFRSRRTDSDISGYEQLADQMVELAEQQPGFLGLRSFRNEDGQGVTISYWQDRESIARWGAHAEHLQAQQRGREEFYSEFTLEICEVQQVRRKSFRKHS